MAFQPSKKFASIPLLRFLCSVREEEYDKIHGFELGIDDYVVKPFSPKELMMRINAIIKRVNPANDETRKEIIRFEGLTIDFTGRIVLVDGEKVELSPKEYDLLFIWSIIKILP